MNASNKDKGGRFNHIKGRRKASISVCRSLIFKICLCRSESGKAFKLLRGKGKDRIGKELDIVKFMKKQMMMDTVLKTLFTRLELYLMKNQKQFVLQK